VSFPRTGLLGWLQLSALEGSGKGGAVAAGGGEGRGVVRCECAGGKGSSESDLLRPCGTRGRVVAGRRALADGRSGTAASSLYGCDDDGRPFLSPRLLTPSSAAGNRADGGGIVAVVCCSRILLSLPASCCKQASFERKADAASILGSAPYVWRRRHGDRAGLHGAPNYGIGGLGQCCKLPA
jgi:hypothetical protein